MKGRPDEDLSKNPFLCVLQKSFEGLYRRAVERGDLTLVVPCAECLGNSSFDQVFVETHVLRAAPVPGCFINLCGQGVELKDSSVQTDLGFAEKRICQILQTESMYEFCNHFRVLVTDKPLVGRFRPVAAAADRGSSASAAATAVVGANGLSLPRIPGPADQPLEWLDAAPDIQDAHFDEVARFRNTFVQVPGCEQSTAERIREIVDQTVQKLIRHHNLDQPSQQRQLDYQVSRNTYTALHSWIWRHLLEILTSAEDRLDKGLKSFASVDELVEACPGASGRSLGAVDIARCSEQLDEVDHKISPHEKIMCINEAYSALQKCIADGARSAGQTGVEITGDDVLALFTLAVYRSSWTHRLAHVAHMEMYLQGAAGRSGTTDAARFEEAGYAVSALQGALQFFLEAQERQTGPAAGGRGRGGGGGSSIIASFVDKPGSGDVEGDSAGMQLSGLVRQARAQGASSWR